MILKLNSRQVTMISKLVKVSGLPHGLFINKPQFYTVIRDDVKLHMGYY